MLKLYKNIFGVKAMEFEKIIEERRSIRRFDSSKKVSREMIEEIIRAAVEAPSWKNQQTSRYYCILNEEMKLKFLSECLPEFNARNSEGASALIVAAFVKNCVGFNADGEPVNEIGNGWGCYDLGLQNENMILKARELGLDTLIMGIRDANKIQCMMNIPESETVVAVIAVGYAFERPKKPERKTVEEITKFFI